MAELASGAVRSLLGLLREEARLLDRVGGDVEFIKEEMESMQSFLEHLARTAPHGDGHDEQVRTWMKQVQDLAHDCSNFFDLYLLRGDPEVYRARLSRWRYYVWWASWLVHRLLAQRKAAVRLAELKERARDVGKRRLRYGVEIPAGAASLPSSSRATAASVEDHGEHDDDDNISVQDEVADAFAVSHHGALEPCALEEYCVEKLMKWLQQQANNDDEVSSIPSIAIVVPDGAENASVAIRSGPLSSAAAGFEHKVWINLPAVHLPWDLPLAPWYILAYILREFDKAQGKVEDLQREAYRYRYKLSDNICDVILGNQGDFLSKMNEIKMKIEEIGIRKVEVLEETPFQKKGKITETKGSMNVIDKRLGVLLRALRLMFTEPDPGVPLSYEEAVGETARLMKSHIEGGDQSEHHLTQAQYEDILRKVFPERKALLPPPPTADQEAGKDQIITAIIENQRTLLDIIRDLLPRQQQLLERSSGNEKLDSSSAAAAAIKETEKKIEEISGEVNKETNDYIAAAAAAAIKETEKKIEEISGEVSKETNDYIATAINGAKEKVTYDIRWEIQDQLFITAIADKIKTLLKHKKTLIILQDDNDYISQWEETIKDLNLLGCVAGSAVIVSTKNSQNAKQFCSAQWEPITWSLVGLYHDIVLQLTKQQDYDKQILSDILDKCHPHEFCMKIFAQALHVNPKRSDEELQRLHQDLVLQEETLGSNAQKVLKFSYNDLSREYKTCLLYLAIFPQGHNIRRSTLIGRWVTEGLITKENWRSAVRHAERCFDSLIKRGLVLPLDIGAAGKVKSCMVGHQVHGFITKIANKEHIFYARLSDQWARHFSIFSGLRLRASDSIDRFLEKLPRYSPQLPLLKVLDLEGCECFHKSNYLKDICKKVLLLKYLSLRRTNVAKLPTEINNLHELEVLDIRQTNVPESATRDVLLLKLKRLLASRVDPLNDKPSCSAVQIPCQIEKMDNLEVLSNVKSSMHGRELEGIRHLWQLRKLGVVIEDKQSHISYLLQAITDLHECLQSLSITISKTGKSKPLQEFFQSLPITIPNIRKSTSSRIQGSRPLRKLESLSINGFTQMEWPTEGLLNFLAKDCDELAKVALSGTKQEDLKVLSIRPKLRCIRLQSGAYYGSEIIFKKGQFEHLKHFLVEDTQGNNEMTKLDIKFEDGAPELEKIVLSNTNISSLCGIGNLPKLKELELEGNQFLLSFSQDATSPEQSIQGTTPEQNSENKTPEQSTNQSRATEENTESNDVEPITESVAPEQRTHSECPEKNTGGIAHEENTEDKAPGSNFIFKKGEFQHLEYFCVKDYKKKDISFDNEAVPELKKIDLSLDDKNSKVTGVTFLHKLREIVLRGDKFLLSFFDNANQITKVTLHDTQLKQVDMQTLALAKKPNLRSLVLSENCYVEECLVFHKDDFPDLNLLIVECFKIHSISFDNRSAPNLEKIVWVIKEMNSLSGIDNLQKLKEVEYFGDLIPYKVRRDIAALVAKPILTHKKLWQYIRAD